MSRFKLGTDYKAAFEAAVNELIDKNIEDRAERIRAIDELINEYVNAIGSAPDPKQLERLADYILREELTDSSKDKVSREEYPILSEWQLARRTSGKHQRKEGAIIEVSLSAAKYIATDGRDYRYPKRRKRTVQEMLFIDENAKIRNKERRRKYKEFTKPSEVKVYNLYDKK